MSILAWPKKVFYSLGSRFAIYLVKRKVRKGPVQPYVWLVLARLYEIRSEYNLAVDVLQQGLNHFPNNQVLLSHLERIKTLPSQ